MTTRLDVVISIRVFERFDLSQPIPRMSALTRRTHGVDLIVINVISRLMTMIPHVARG